MILRGKNIMGYDYRAGKKRIKEVLEKSVIIEEKRTVPCENDFTFDNAYKCWISSIFIDIRKSTELFNSDNKKNATKIIRSFTSEIIEILNEEKDTAIEEIGIRGDCVYAIYSTPTTDMIYEIIDRAFWINSFLNMLNKLLSNYGLSTIKAGIVVSTAQEVIIKAGRKYSGVNSKVWIGNAVTKASKLSGVGNKNNHGAIVMSSCTHYNIIDKFKKRNGEKSAEWFKKVDDKTLGTYYHCNITKNELENWIKEGMK